VFIIGIDPHKGSHHATVIDRDEQVLGEVRIRADRRQRDQLLAFAAPFTPRTWAVEGAAGLGLLLAQQLVAAGETVVDVPAKLAARVRVLDCESSDKTDSHDSRAAAIVGLHNKRLRMVGHEESWLVLRMLAKRHRDLIARRTQSVCRLHAVLCALVEGGVPKNLSAQRASSELRRIRSVDAVAVARREMAVELLAEVRRVDAELVALRKRITAAVAATATTVTDVYGVGPIVAAYLIGYSGDIDRFADAGHYARYNATAPLAASSGDHKRHRLNQKGNRQLNHALHLAAVTQISHATPGRDYYLRKLDEKKNPKEALRALKRRISNAVYRQLVNDARRS